MFGSSAIRVIQETPSTLVVIEPSHAGGWILIGAGVVWFIGAFFLIGLSKTKLLGYLVMLLPPLLMALAGTAAVTMNTRAIFSKADNRVTVDDKIFGISMDHVEVPLSDVQYAEVIHIDVTRNVLLHLNSGKVVHIGGNSDRSGHYEATHAINTFLRGGAVTSGQNPPPTKL